MALADYQRDIDIVEVSSSSLDMPTNILNLYICVSRYIS